jgi:hypothetical protein
MPRNLDKKCCSRIPSLERRDHCIVKYVMTPQPQFTSGGFFISLQRDRRVTAYRTNNYKARLHAHFLKLHRKRNVSSNHTLERRHERETNAKKMSPKELKMTTKGKFVKRKLVIFFLMQNLCRRNNQRQRNNNYLLTYDSYGPVHNRFCNT